MNLFFSSLCLNISNLFFERYFFIGSEKENECVCVCLSVCVSMNYCTYVAGKKARGREKDGKRNDDDDKEGEEEEGVRGNRFTKSNRLTL